jgi:DNA transformation protein
VPVSADYLQYLIEQLAALGELRAQRMFGGVGLYCDEVFFGIVSEDTLYLRVDDAGRAEFTARGMQPFRPHAERAAVSLSYYEVPAELLEDPPALTTWSRRAVAAARQRPQRKGRAREPATVPAPGSAARSRTRRRRRPA